MAVSARVYCQSMLNSDKNIYPIEVKPICTLPNISLDNSENALILKQFLKFQAQGVYVKKNDKTQWNNVLFMGHR